MKNSPPSDSPIYGALVLAHPSAVAPATSEAVARQLARIGDRIRIVRDSRKLSMRRLAQLTGIGRPCLSNIESGFGDAKLSQLLMVARALDVSAAWILKAV